MGNTPTNAPTERDRMIARGRTYRALVSGEWSVRIWGKSVIAAVDWEAWSMSLRHPFRGPKVTMRCGQCLQKTTDFPEPVRAEGVTQDWSAVVCGHCGAVNAVGLVYDN